MDEIRQEPTLSQYRDKAIRLAKIEGLVRRLYPTDRDRDDTEEAIKLIKERISFLLQENKRLLDDLKKLKKNVLRVREEMLRTHHGKFAEMLEQALKEVENGEQHE
jgi:hypothetical protein